MYRSYYMFNVQLALAMPTSLFRTIFHFVDEYLSECSFLNYNFHKYCLKLTIVIVGIVAAVVVSLVYVFFFCHEYYATIRWQ